MSKEECYEFEGQVYMVMPNGFKVRLDNGHEIIAHISGKIRKSRIRVLIGDRVLVEMNHYDTKKGRIIHRLKAG
ncbi:translation initiation factor IF-1 [Rickettsiales bacterium]|nr:translation initiation factor IF-1 [Rickettsiales bacterium]